MVDFNNPLAGKNVKYNIKVLRKVEDINEKVKSLNEFFFRADFDFKVEEKKLILKVPKGMEKLAEIFRGKYKELLGLELEVKEVESSKPEDQKIEVKKPLKKAVKPIVKPVKVASVKAEMRPARGTLKADVYDIRGKIIEKADLPKEIFAA